MIKLKKILIIAMIVFVVFSCNKKQEQNKTKKVNNIDISQSDKNKTEENRKAERSFIRRSYKKSGRGIFKGQQKS